MKTADLRPETIKKAVKEVLSSKNVTEAISTANAVNVRKVASILQIPNYGKMKKEDLQSLILGAYPAEEVKKTETKAPQKGKVREINPTAKLKQPRPGTKAAEIFKLLKEGEMTKYKIALVCGTYYSVVAGVVNRYKEALDAK